MAQALTPSVVNNVDYDVKAIKPGFCDDNEPWIWCKFSDIYAATFAEANAIYHYFKTEMDWKASISAEEGKGTGMQTITGGRVPQRNSKQVDLFFIISFPKRWIHASDVNQGVLDFIESGFKKRGGVWQGIRLEQWREALTNMDVDDEETEAMSEDED